jgi:hypothetical protein
MSNNDEMQVDHDRGHGKRAPNKKNEGHGSRGHTGGSRGASENEREQVHQEQGNLQEDTSNHKTDNHDQWTEVGGRAKGGEQKNKYNKDDNSNISKVHDQWNRDGTRSSGGYHSNDNQNCNRDIFGNINGDRAGRNADRGVESNTKTNNDVTTSYTYKTGFIEVRYMWGSGRGFNIARAIKEFVTAARKQDPKFSILPLHGSRNNICNAMDVPGNREGIARYYRHEVKANNANGKLRIRSSMALGALKKIISPFRNYLDDNRVYINNVQLGDEEGIALGWIFRDHPTFGFCDDIKER